MGKKIKTKAPLPVRLKQPIETAATFFFPVFPKCVLVLYRCSLSHDRFVFLAPLALSPSPSVVSSRLDVLFYFLVYFFAASGSKLAPLQLVDSGSTRQRGELSRPFFSSTRAYLRRRGEGKRGEGGSRFPGGGEGGGVSGADGVAHRFAKPQRESSAAGEHMQGGSEPALAGGETPERWRRG